jgi:hypothetical protein
VVLAINFGFFEILPSETLPALFLMVIKDPFGDLPSGVYNLVDKPSNDSGETVDFGRFDL